MESYLKLSGNGVFCIIHPEPSKGFHSIILWEYLIPNIIFQWDTFTIPEVRLLASKPYDIQVVCHPEYENYYKENECKNVLILPWCIDNLLFNELVSKNNYTRIFDIGWVGRSDTWFYKNRSSVLSLIQNNNFTTNDVNKYYDWPQMFEIYLQSKIVINISRDDYSKDANMRCFEAMGCGALLFTQLPSELVELGFKEGKHFIGFENEIDLLKKVNYYLENTEERLIIAAEAQNKVLTEHTYLKRVEKLIGYVNNAGDDIIKRSWFRKLSNKNKYYYLAFSFYKEGELSELARCFLKVIFKRKIVVFKMLLISILKKTKKHFLNSVRAIKKTE